MVVVYTKPDCVMCDQTKRYLEKHNIEYETFDVTTDDSAMAKVKELGYLSMPVVVTDTDDWSGFRLEKLKNLTYTGPAKESQ